MVCDKSQNPERGEVMAKKVLVVHGSPRVNGNSAQLADAFTRGAEDAGHEVTRIEVGRADIRGCLACEYCFSHEGACCQQDAMQEFYPLLREADVIVWATPLYCYNYPAQLRAFQDRMFCGIAKPFGVKQTGLLLCFEDKDETRAEPLLDVYRVNTAYCGQESIGEVVVKAVYEVGAIAGNPGLQEAYDLGASLA